MGARGPWILLCGEPSVDDVPWGYQHTQTGGETSASDQIIPDREFNSFTTPSRKTGPHNKKWTGVCQPVWIDSYLCGPVGSMLSNISKQNFPPNFRISDAREVLPSNPERIVASNKWGHGFIFGCIFRNIIQTKNIQTVKIKNGNVKHTIRNMQHETCNMKHETWNLKPETWKLELETWIRKIKPQELKFSNWKSKVETYSLKGEMNVWFENWDFNSNLSLDI